MRHRPRRALPHRKLNEKGFSFIENIMGLALITLVSLLILPMLAIASAQGASSAGSVTASAKLQGVIESVRSEPDQTSLCNAINKLIATPSDEHSTANGTKYSITAKLSKGGTCTSADKNKALDIEFSAITIEDKELLSRLNTKVYVP